MNILNKPLKLLLSVVALLFLAITLILSFGVRVDLSPWKDTILKAANKSLPYELSLNGEMEATIAFQPSVRLANVSLSPESEPGEPIASVGYVSAKVGLLPLLRNIIDIDHILLDSVNIHLTKNEQGESNWQVAPDSIPQEMEITGEQAEYESTSLPGYRLKIENRIVLKNLDFAYIDKADALRFDAAMESLSIAIDTNNDLVLNAHGTLDGTPHNKTGREPWNIESTIALDSILQTKQGIVDLKAYLADASLQLNGIVNLADEENSDLTLHASLPTTNIIEQFSGQDMSLLAPVSLEGRMVGNATTVHLTDLDITAAGSQLTGVIHMEQAETPIIEGSLGIDKLNLEPWLELAGNEQPEPSNDTASAESAPEDDETVPLAEALHQWLNRAEIDFDFFLGSVDGLPAPINDTRLALTMKGGHLHAPVSLAVAEIPLSGQLTMEAKNNTVTLDTDLTTENANVGPLFTVLLDEDAEGQVDNLDLKLTAEGATVSELLRHALLDFKLGDGQLTIDNDLHWKLHAIDASLGLKRDTSIQVDAELLDVPLDLNIQADPLIALQAGRPWQVQIDADSPALKGTAKGFVSEKGLKEDSRFAVDMNVEKLGALANWLGIEKDSSQSVQLSGELLQQQNVMTVSLPAVQIGSSSGMVAFNWDTSATAGMANLRTHFSKLELDELLTLLPEQEETTKPAMGAGQPAAGPTPGPIPGPTPGPTPGPSPGPTPGMPSATPEMNGINVNAPLLRQNFNIPDANIMIQVDEMTLAGKTLSHVTFNGEIRNSHLSPSPFSVEFVGSRFYGDLAADLRNQIVAMDFDLSVDQPDFGRILTELNMVSDIDLSLDKASFSLNLKGRTIAELIQQIRMNANLKGGELVLTDANTGATSTIRLNSGSVTAQPNMRLTLKMDGEMKELPVDIEVSFNPLNRLLTRRKNVNMQLSVRLPDIHLLSYSVVNLPLEQRTMRLGVILKTPNLTALNPVLDVDMPPLGPVEIHGRFGVNPDGYEIRQSTVNIGDSRLRGDMKLVTLGDKPDLAIHLSAPTIQLDDFRLGDWKAWDTDNGEDKNGEEQVQKEVAKAPEEAQAEPVSNLISAETMNALNVSFNIDVDEVLSGKDHLGKGILKLNLKEGDLTLNPLFVALPGGEIYATGHLKPVDDGFNIALKSNIDRFDYGVMARRIDPKTNMQGEVSVNIDIDTTAATPDDLFRHATGNFGFAVWPREFQAGIIDLWAVGLASAVLPKIGSADPSQLNCAVGTFNLTDGQMSDIALMLDTSRMQVAGQTTVDFTQQKIDMLLVPRAKTAQIFGLSLPVRVRGSFTDFGIGVPTSEAVLTTFRFVTSPVITPLRWIFEQPLEANGSQLCQDIFNQSRGASPLQP